MNVTNSRLKILLDCEIICLYSVNCRSSYDITERRFGLRAIFQKVAKLIPEMTDSLHVGLILHVVSRGRTVRLN